VQWEAMMNEPAVPPNFDPIAIGDEVAALEREAQSKLADAKSEFASRSEKIAAILWNVKQHHPEYLDAICKRAEIGRSRRKELLQIGKRSQDDQAIPAGDRGAPSKIQGEEKGQRCRATRIRGRY
jgi:hypothetical protein